MGRQRSIACGQENRDLIERGKMAASPQTPKSCPLCCSSFVERVMDDTLLSARPDGLAPHVLEVVAYQCDGGHVFLLPSESFRWTQPRREGNGYGIMV